MTPRQTEVFELICRGRSNEEIAKQLRISKKTVEIHMQRMRDALEIPDTRPVRLWLLGVQYQELRRLKAGGASA